MENPFEIINERLKNIEKLLENIYPNIETQETNMNTSKIMSIEQLSNYLNLSKSHIYKLTSSHTIPHSKRGKRLYFDKEIINTWVLENKICTQDDIEKQATEYLIKNRKKF